MIRFGDNREIVRLNILLVFPWGHFEGGMISSNVRSERRGAYQLLAARGYRR